MTQFKLRVSHGYEENTHQEELKRASGKAASVAKFI